MITSRILSNLFGWLAYRLISFRNFEEKNTHLLISYDGGEHSLCATRIYNPCHFTSKRLSIGLKGICIHGAISHPIQKRF